MKQFDLEEIKRAIAEKYQWGNSVDWTNFHFKELSKDIEAATGDRLSDETLKRIFGKRKVNSEKYHPQAFSQMALAKFAESLIIADSTAAKAEPVQLNHRRFPPQSIKWLAIGIGLIALLFLTKSYPRNAVNYQFSCENQQDTYPFTATFRYNISEIADSVFTDFGNLEETYLSPEKNQINHFYSNSGVCWTKFYTRKRVLDSLRITAFSKDWQGGYYPNMKPEMFQPFNNQNFYRQADYFYALPSELKNEGADLNQRIWTTYRYFSPFAKSLDVLTLETRVKNNASTGSLICYDTEIILIGDSGTIDFKFTQPKCSRWASLKVSEKYLTGEFNDLSPFTVDMSDWQPITMVTANGQCSIFLDEKPIFTQNYQHSLGSLLGVVFQFYGSGKIDYLHLKDARGNIFYTNEFKK